jgi:23S rRNA pseudouridine2605 synthase
MRLNKWLAYNTSLSRRGADAAIADDRVKVNGNFADLGQDITSRDVVTLDKMVIAHKKSETVIVAVNKPVGYVCSHDGQGSDIIFDLLPPEYQRLNIAGRLDKDSSGLVILTNDGDLLNKLTHPSKGHKKEYIVQLDRPLSDHELFRINDPGQGVSIGDGRPSLFGVKSFESRVLDNNQKINESEYSMISSDDINRVVAVHNYKVLYPNSSTYLCMLSEGRNRQIRRTFEALGLEVIALHRLGIS